MPPETRNQKNAARPEDRETPDTPATADSTTRATGHRDDPETEGNRGERQKRMSASEELCIELMEQLEELKGTIGSLQRRIEVLERAETPRSQASDPSPIEAPSPFSGSDASQLKPFLRQLKLYFFNQPRRFSNDREKVVHPLSLLKGDAFSLFAPMVDDYGFEDMPFEALCTQLQETFLPNNHLDQVSRDLKSIKQTSTGRSQPQD
ncbi:uncharacterized protein BJ171DRAFT_567051 [Polychytrium aggregatum]|uniref:uncharacterized protein n=1 Tax=Polychytrium aggregatum TaxID=110093 RepID=UPI0022FDDC83|nr:uncharacterized protein BJ171DRAFT_567051 [Polychytrium aggregatum]KAI9206255.1 hypothetical protein BJ171DRAFT_567051 [Polychytrium aggregatum]